MTKCIMTIYYDYIVFFKFFKIIYIYVIYMMITYEVYILLRLFCGIKDDCIECVCSYNSCC